MRYFLTIVIFLAVVTAGLALYVLSGYYNIAATSPHWNITLSLIDTLRDRSIEVHSKGIQAPNLDDPKLKELAFPHYHEMCRLCHGAPGYSPEEFAPGLYPSPPSMTSGKIQQALKDTEIYWIVKHGIKMTGMPAFGPTHTEKIMWGLVALAEEVPRMTPEQYRRQVKDLGLAKEMSGGHQPHQGVSEKDQEQMVGRSSAHDESEHEQH